MSAPADAKAKQIEPEQAPARRIPALTKRIVIFNAFALFILIAGVLWIQSNRVGLVDERISGIREQALIVAGTLAEYTVDADTRTIDLRAAEPLLRQSIAPTKLRARLYNAQARLILDTRYLLQRNAVTTTELPPPESSNRLLAFFERSFAFLERMYDGIMGVRPLANLERYTEGNGDGRIYSEVVSAIGETPASSVRVNEQDKLVLSVAVPIERFSTLYGVLMLTTESGDIDDILKEERRALIEVFLVAFAALFLSSLYLAGFIARPIQMLAAAADRVRRGHGGREAMPQMQERGDEIGELADSLSAMTRALYDRIDAIESFAADVAHELKNPLTSLKSAIEMMQRTGEPEKKAHMVDVIQGDIRRIDRLISEISDASRLDAELSRTKSEPVDFGKLMRTIVEIYQDQGNPRGVKLALSLPSTPMTVNGIDERLGQVFRNLIDNAISFSPENSTISISTRLNPRGTAVITEVCDEGQGIPEENLETIFSRFYTERPVEHGFGKNSGLGLAIARQIVTSHGGNIWAENRYEGGQRMGARLIVELPLAWPT